MEYSQKTDSFTQLILEMAKNYVKSRRNIEIIDILSLKHRDYEIFATFLTKDKEELKLNFRWRFDNLKTT